MPLVLYKRHTKACCTKHGIEPHDRSFRRCGCTIHAEGTLRKGGFIRTSTKETTWDAAEELKRKWEAAGTCMVEERAVTDSIITVEDAVNTYLRDISERNWSAGTVSKCRGLLLERGVRAGRDESEQNPALVQFARTKGIVGVSQITVADIAEFRATWKCAPLTASKALEQLRAFFRSCIEREWMLKDPAAAKTLKIKVTTQEKEPFVPEEYARILDAVNLYPDDRWGNIGENAKEMRAMVLTLRHTGLRVGDAAGLEKSAIVRSPSGSGWSVHVYQEKVKRWVYIPVLDELVQALRMLPFKHERYLFWTGNGDFKTAKTNWRNRLTKLFRLAETQTGSQKPFAHNPHPHRFRHTFAAEYLLSGMDIRDVSLLLGHKSVAVTEKHYAQFNARAQARLEEAARRLMEAQAAGAAKLKLVTSRKATSA